MLGLSRHRTRGNGGGGTLGGCDSQRSDLFIGQELGLKNELQRDTWALKCIVEWVHRRWDYRSFGDHLAEWLLLSICLIMYVILHRPGRCFFLMCCDIITQKPLTMNCHNQTLGTDAIKKSKERAQLPLLILRWKCKSTANGRKITLEESPGTLIYLLTPPSRDWIECQKKKPVRLVRE